MNIITKKKLIVYDLSSIIFPGAKSGLQCKWSYNGIPTGGLYKFFSALVKDLKECGDSTSIIICMDSKLQNSKRRSIAPFYKQNRSSKNFDYFSTDIETLNDLKFYLDSSNIKMTDIKEYALQESAVLQLLISESIIKHLNIPYLVQDGYEADDLIYSLCFSYPDKSILIRADDSDLIDCKLFNRNVVFHPQTNKGINNAPTGVLLSKILDGDRTDNYGGIKTIPNSSTIVELLHKGILRPSVIKQAESIQDFPFKDLETFGFSYEQALSIFQTIFCAYPFLFKLDTSLFDNFVSVPDMELLKDYLSAFGMKRILKQFACEPYYNDVIDKYIKSIKADIPPLLEMFLTQ